MNVVKRSVRNHPYVALTILIIIVALIYTMVVFPQYQAEKYLSKLSDADKQKPEVQRSAFDIENANRLTIAQILGGFALLLGLYFTYQNVKVAQDNAKIAQRNLWLTEEGNITDRFSKAVELLGSDKLDIRLGGIYALERIALDSQKDHWTVMEVLTAFVRGNAPRPDKPFEDNRREDIQAIMTVIGRKKWGKTEIQRLNLYSVNLTGYFLEEANLKRANLSRSKLVGAYLGKANLVKAILKVTDLSSADLRVADLTGADLQGANLSDAELNEANLSEADLTSANLKETYLEMTNLSETKLKFAKNLTIGQIIMAKNYMKSRLPEKLEKELKEWQAKQST